MATLTINGRKVTVDDSFRDLSPEEQEATVEEISQSMGGGEQPQPEFTGYADPQQNPLLAEMSADSNRLTGEIANIDQARYAALPGWAKPLVALQDTADLVTQGASFGFGDKIVAGLRAPFTDKTYTEELEGQRELTESARNRAQGAGVAAELAGSVRAPLSLANRGLTLAGRFGTGAMEGAKGLIARSLLMGTEGAGYGTLTAAGNDESLGWGAGLGAAGGFGGNVLGEGLAAGVNKVAGAFNPKPAIPTRAEIDAAKSAAYKRAEQAGVAYTPQAVDTINKNLRSELSKIGYHPRTMPGASAAVDELAALQGQNVTLEGLDVVRKIASGGYIPGNKANNSAITKIIQTIDDLAENPGTGDVLMGNGQEGAEALKEARRLASQSFKLEKVETAVRNAEIDAAASGSGGNVNNRTRQLLKPLVKNPRGFTQDEQEALMTAIKGTPGQNLLRLGGKLSPSGNGLMLGLQLAGAGATGGASIPLAAGGMVAKALADRGTGQNVQRLTDIILAGGSKAATQAPPNAVQRLAQAKREAVVRALMGIGANVAGSE